VFSNNPLKEQRNLALLPRKGTAVLVEHQINEWKSRPMTTGRDKRDAGAQQRRGGESPAYSHFPGSLLTWRWRAWLHRSLGYCNCFKLMSF